MAFQADLTRLQKEAIRAIGGTDTPEKLAAVRLRYVGRKGELTALLKSLSGVSAEDRRTWGGQANAVKTEIESALDQHAASLRLAGSAHLGKSEWVDVTAPGLPLPVGHLHLSTHAMTEITAIFRRLGFTRMRYPEVDYDWFAFEALNMPPEHPARDEWETFFVDLPPGERGKVVLTPHTSNGQIHELLRGELPVRMINISKCYRRQSDISHVPMFHQFEGLLIDKGVNVTHLKGVLDWFARAYFGPERRTRLRPFHFRFTEPSFEVDISCDICGGTGKQASGERCRICKEGWLELGGAGMVHPNVLKATGVDPEAWGGFAFGWGLERTFMMKSGLRIDDIRLLYKNDMRFLTQF